METARYPNLLRRYLAALIDAIVIILLVVFIGRLLAYAGSHQGLGVLVFLLVLLAYEPLLTAFLCTVGQALMRFRVRDLQTGGRVPLWRVYIRVVVKTFLGIISFL